MHSYHAYIDESGDDGFVFKDWPERASSEWFVVSACVVRASKHSEASAALHSTIDPFESSHPIHFAKLHHEQRVAIIHGLARTPMRTICICFNKRALGTAGHTLIGNRRLYFYATRYLIERISWLARDNANVSPGDGRCKLHFSKCGGLSYPDLIAYFARLRGMPTNIAWQHIETDHFDIATHESSVWLRATDCVATGFARAFELTPYGFCEDRYAMMLKPVVYCHRRSHWGYGLKVTPHTPTPEKKRDNRYAWLSLYRQ